MKANELRIGNWVRLREHDAFIQIEQYQLCESELINLQPIPITEEWLVKSGASKQNGYQYRFLYGFLIIRNGICFYKYYDLEIELNYVHQLQNLYFALTGEELTYGGNK